MDPNGEWVTTAIGIVNGGAAAALVVNSVLSGTIGGAAGGAARGALGAYRSEKYFIRCWREH